MDIVVCLKQINDPGSVEVNPLTGKVDEKRLVKITSPSDLCALEAALQIKEECGGTVTVLSLGPVETDKCLKEALAMGADQVLRIWEYDWENVFDPQLIAYALSSYIKKQAVDLVLCGDEGDNYHASEVPAWLSEYMAMPLITSTCQLIVQEDLKSIKVKRKLEKGKRQVMECDLPAVLAVTKSLNQPRENTLPRLITALENEIPVAKLLMRTIAQMMPQNINREIRYQVQPIRPDPQLIYTPDGSLSVEERIEGLVSGGMVRKKAEFVQGSPEEAAQRIIEFLKEQEAIKSETEEN